MWMSEKARPVVEAICKQAFGPTLEIAFGMGISHAALHSNQMVTEITSIEMSQEIIDYYHKCNCTITCADWRDAIRELPKGHFKTIYFDIPKVKLVELKCLVPLLAAPQFQLLRYVALGSGFFEVISKQTLEEL